MANSYSKSSVPLCGSLTGEGHRGLCLACRAKASSWEINGGAARAAHRPDRPGRGRDACDHRLDLVDDPTALAG